MVRRLLAFLRENKMIRGMVSYGVLWPCGSLIEQTLSEKRTLTNYDWQKCCRYSLFGSTVIAPTMFFWVRLAALMWPKTDFRSSLSKGLTEQVALDPFGIALFLYSMSRMEGKSVSESKRELRNKFFDVFKVGVIYWPAVQTVNFMFVPVHNQVVVTSIFSLIWSTFLAYVKSADLSESGDPTSIDMIFEEI